MTNCKPNPEIVLSIHGTFAASELDRGPGWWQIGSSFSERFASKLPRGVTMPDGSEPLFHWSGANTERDRELAAVKLLETLQAHDLAGRSYHLIGHSHGGSLIWAALRMACRKGILLKGLRSWSTVGTPFLNKKSLSMIRWSSALRCGIGLVLAGPCLVSAVLLGKFLLANASEVSGPLQVVGGLTLLVLCLYAALCILSMLAAPLLESWQIRQDEQLDRKAMELYGDRWLGLWSPDDEAINGLRATLDMPLSFVGRYSPREQVFASDRLHALGRPHQWLFGLAYNGVLQPVLNRIVTRQVIKTLQGNNRPGGKIVSVHPWPTENVLGREYPQLPSWLCERIVQRADQGARNMAPKLRQLLAGSPLTAASRLAESVSGSELVHTSYFVDDQIGSLLALHIAWATNNRVYLSRMTETWPQGVIWFGRFKSSLGVRVSTAIDSGQTWLAESVQNQQRGPAPIHRFYSELDALIHEDSTATKRKAA
ncbi:hypothetical protein FF011L_18110 [Roseimaritima multifibrata]|uniref:Alpha/beta hydrolase family protein n=1 Tax=Roseimaritima multifibrata TaxID=1930274 RepID=A0A517MDZ6_9BACT|nr:alpha/beta hydrolase [Roseimaritima multifibrata]QDS93056.1 hypothetical protein FF011L_18110 [Roseimaritima multifibrata]